MTRARQVEPEALGAAPGLAIPAAEMALLQAHALEAYPQECCGILVGRPGPRPEVVASHPALNQRRERARDRYEIHPGELLRADRAARREGLEVVGFYHSHPDHPPAPSATDAEQAWPGYIYVIVAVLAGRETESRAFAYDDATCQFSEWRIEVEPDPALAASGRRKAIRR